MRRHVVLTSVMTSAVLLVGCSDGSATEDGSDGAAIRVCRDALSGVAGSDRLASNVRPDGASGYTVKAWVDGRAEGAPDYVCEVVRDASAERGVRIRAISPSPQPSAVP